MYVRDRQNTTMKLSLSCLLFFVATAFGAAVDNKCHFSNVEECGAPLQDFRKESGQRFPTTEEQVTNLCHALDEANDCFTRYKDSCMTPMQLQMMGLVTEGAHEVYTEFCKSGSEIRTDYLQHAECMNQAYESDEYKELANYVEAGMEQIENKPYPDRLPTACCGYHWLDSRSRKLGAEKCGEDAVDAFQKVVSMAASNLPEVFCSGFDPDAEQCTKVLPAPGTKPTGSIRNSHIGKSFSNIYM